MSLSLNLLTTSQLSTLIKRAPETLIRWRRLRVGPPYLLIGGRVLYEEREVRNWLNARRTPMTDPNADKPSARRPRSVSTSPSHVSAEAIAPPNPVRGLPLAFNFDPCQTWEVFDT